MYRPYQKSITTIVSCNYCSTVAISREANVMSTRDNTLFFFSVPFRKPCRPFTGYSKIAFPLNDVTEDTHSAEIGWVTTEVLRNVSNLDLILEGARGRPTLVKKKKRASLVFDDNTGKRHPRGKSFVGLKKSNW